MFKTHVAFALLLAVIFVQWFDMQHWYLFLFVTVFMAGIPDIDVHKSKFGSKVKPLSWLINLFFGHRGLFHSFILAIALYFVFSSFGSNTLGAAALLGYSSHLVLDSLTRQGIMPLTPISRFRLRGLIKTGDVVDWGLFFVFIVLTILVLI
jgi:inner membrane protein